MATKKVQPRHRRACRPVTPLDTITQSINPQRSIAAASITGIALSIVSGSVANAAPEHSTALNTDALKAATTVATVESTTLNRTISAPASMTWDTADDLEVEAEAPGEAAFADDRENEAADRSAWRTAVDVPPNLSGGAASIAAQYLGVPYVWAGESPAGFDCSGLVKYVFAQLGYSLPHSAGGIAAMGTVISAGDAQPGDIVYYSYGHVGIYIGGGQMIHASVPGDVVRIASIEIGNYVFIRL